MVLFNFLGIKWQQFSHAKFINLSVADLQNKTEAAEEDVNYIIKTKAHSFLRTQSNTTLRKVRYFDRSPPVVVVISITRSADRGQSDKPVDRVFTHI